MPILLLIVGGKGNGNPKGTHVSSFIHLTIREFDDQLKWPFCGDITVNLPNNEEDEDHVAVHIKLPTQ